MNFNQFTKNVLSKAISYHLRHQGLLYQCACRRYENRTVEGRLAASFGTLMLFLKNSEPDLWSFCYRTYLKCLNCCRLAAHRASLQTLHKSTTRQQLRPRLPLPPYVPLMNHPAALCLCCCRLLQEEEYLNRELAEELQLVLLHLPPLRLDEPAMENFRLKRLARWQLRVAAEAFEGLPRTQRTTSKQSAGTPLHFFFLAFDPLPPLLGFRPSPAEFAAFSARRRCLSQSAAGDGRLHAAFSRSHERPSRCFAAWVRKNSLRKKHSSDSVVMAIRRLRLTYQGSIEGGRRTRRAFEAVSQLWKSRM
eukprot:284818917_4